VLMIGYAAITFHELRAYHLSNKQHKQPHHHHKNSSHSPNEIVANLPSPTPIVSPGTLSARSNPHAVLPTHIEFPRTPSLSTPVSKDDIEASQPSTMTHIKERYPNNHVTTKAHRPRRKQWSGNWDPMLLGIAAFQFVVFTYFIVSTELLLQWNPYQTDGNKWGFGQILALIVVIPSALAVVDAFSEHGFKRLHKKRTGRRGKSRQDSSATTDNV